MKNIKENNLGLFTIFGLFAVFITGLYKARCRQ